MKPKKILIASVLKPADDVRMAWKIGRSLSKIENTEIHVAGFTPNNSKIEGLTLRGLFNFSRLSMGRAWANFKILKLCLRLKPAVFIIATHELLPAALLSKLILGSRIVYDVRENYYRNIRYTGAFPKLLRLPLANLVRAIERVSDNFIDCYLLAEQTYFNELPYVRPKAVIVENKYLRNQKLAYQDFPKIPPKKGRKFRLLYSGTIAINYGILEAIKLADWLHQIDKRYELTIIGYAAQPEVLDEVKKSIFGKSYITLIGGDTLVPHARILEAIGTSGIGLLPYHSNHSTDNCIPTKLYEYLANQLLVLVQQNPVWEKLVEQWQAGILVDFRTINAAELHATIFSKQFYQNGAPTSIYWDEEETKLIKAIEDQLYKTKFKSITPT